jgi:hypothetical protein
LDAVKLAAESPARLQKIAPGEPGEVKWSPPSSYKSTNNSLSILTSATALKQWRQFLAYERKLMPQGLRWIPSAFASRALF